MQLSHACISSLIILIDVLPADARAQSAPPPLAQPAIPPAFVENLGQFDSPVRFVANDGDTTVFCTDAGFVLQLRTRSEASGDQVSAETGSKRTAVAQEPVHVAGQNLFFRFEGASASARPTGVDALDGRFNYFLGSDPDRWVTGARAYRAVRIPDLRPGVSAQLSIERGRVLLQLSADEGAELGQLRLACDGGEAMQVIAGGGVVVTTRTTSGEPRQLEVLQVGCREVGGSRVAWLADEGCRLRVVPEGAGSAQPMSTNIFLNYSTFLGGNQLDEAWGVAISAVAVPRTFVCGRTASATIYPRFAGPFDTTYNGGVSDAFVAKFNGAANQLVYASYIGGSALDLAFEVVVNAANEAFVTGVTASSDFPVTAGAFDTSFNGSTYDAFVLKLNATGAALSWSTYLGGAGSELAYAIAIDASDCAYVTGQTSSANFPLTAGAFNTVFNLGSGTGLSDVFVTKLDASGSGLSYSTYLSGEQSEAGVDIALDASNAAHLAVETDSAFMPTSAGALDPTFGGGDDGYTASLNSTGTALLHGTYLATSGADSARGIAVDAAGAHVWVVGYTGSSAFPTTTGAFDTSHNGSNDAFALKLDIPQSTLAYSTFLGGTNADVAAAVSLDANENAYVVGSTYSTDYPVTTGAFDTLAERLEAFATKLDASGSALVGSTYLGDEGADAIYDVAVDSVASIAYVVGYTKSSDFPVSLIALQQVYGGNTDAFMAKIAFP